VISVAGLILWVEKIPCWSIFSNYIWCTISESVVLLQGIPFFHAGDETLRSKSLDRDSYNSGDWFNRLATILGVDMSYV